MPFLRGSDISSKAARRAGCLARPKRFRLAGPTLPLDRRINAIRPDIADVALAATHFASHYAAARAMRCDRPSLPLRDAPNEAARAVSELRYGDCFAVLDDGRGWAWGYSLGDHYVGYVAADALAEPGAPPTHMVCARAALVFAAPDIKATVFATLPMGARVSSREAEPFLAAAGGFIHHRHLRAENAPEADPAAVAERLLGTPYRWGGRSGFGVDCSGLIQLAFAACGDNLPRDSDQQRDMVGTPLADGAPLRRNDLVFFPGHVGIMADGERLIHANAHAMAVTIEPLADVIARGSEVVARRRIAGS